ncbi:MAG TPA: HlyD family secretion protein [Vicinamibacterales bacterium]|nr:HlyD family secretion protein [Vicinamibacterales bacterium]
MADSEVSPNRSRRWLVIGGGLIIVAGLAFFLWRYFSPTVSTDDAQVAGHVNPISARVGGAIKAVHVVDNQAVKANDILVEIDSRDYELALSRAEADLASAEAAAKAAQSDIPVTSAAATGGQSIAEAGTGSAEAALQAAEREVDAANAKVASAQARLTEATAQATRTQQDVERLRPLAAKDEIPRQQFDAAQTAALAAKAGVESAEASVRQEQANVQVSTARRAQLAAALRQAQAQSKAASTAPQQIAQIRARAGVAEAAVQQARALVDQAKLNLERTAVRAPSDGVVSRRTLEVGQVVQPGQALLAITTLDDVWIVANFKETQLRDLRPGQRASVSVDAYGGREYAGHVESISAATGSTFSLLPPDNATGNFVKVVQRVPVRIALDKPPAGAEAVLRPGLSVTVTVTTK